MSLPDPAQPIPFLDLHALHAPLRDELDNVWKETVEWSSFIGGDAVESFEREWADYCQTTHAIGVANGTDSLELILSGMNIGAGHEVIVPANTFVASAEAVVRVGATPVFVDVDPDSLLLNADLVEAAISDRTRAVMVVHLYGQIPEMAPIVELCERRQLQLIEDAAQAHGALHHGRPAGSFGNAGSFSFYPGKNLGAFGDGGAVVTNDDVLAEAIRVESNHGRGHHLMHMMAGRNSRLDGLQAAVLRLKLRHLDDWNQARRRVHTQYVERFEGTQVQVLSTPAGTDGVYHLEVIRVPDRDQVRTALGDADIGSGIHYALPCHQQPAFAEFAPQAPLVVAEHAAASQLSIPIFPSLTEGDVDRVAATVLDAVART